jgi:hypothetical protein
MRGHAAVVFDELRAEPAKGRVVAVGPDVVVDAVELMPSGRTSA